MTDRTELLRGIFTDPRFVWISRFLRFIKVDGAKIGVVISTLNVGFFEYALNKGETERLLAAKHSAKVDETFAVFANVDHTRQMTYVSNQNAEALHQKILAMGLRPRSGVFGEFWTLPSILTMGDDAPM